MKAESMLLVLRNRPCNHTAAKDSGQIFLQMPGVDDPERVKELIGKSSKLELMKIVGPPNPSPVQTYPTKEAAEQSIAGAPNRKVLNLSNATMPQRQLQIRRKKHQNNGLLLKHRRC